MKHLWVGVAEVPVADRLGLAGIFALCNRRKETMLFASLVGMISGLNAFLLPTALTETHANASMIYRPILLAPDILAVVTSIALFVLALDLEPPAIQVIT